MFRDVPYFMNGFYGAIVGNLNRHMKVVHYGKKLSCTQCNLTFGQQYDLKYVHATLYVLRERTPEMRTELD